eukprot:7757942-Pyramimonas_sp.AAC.1
MPVRGACGGLGGPIQTVGRAERAAVWQALSLPPSVSLIATDLWSLCGGGTAWHECHADAQ